MNLVKIKFKSGERLPMLLDAQGLPVVAPCEWILSRRHRSLNTLIRNLQELTPFYAWLDEKCVDLFELIRSARYWTETFLSSLIECLRRAQRQRKKVVKLVVSPDTANKRISTVLRHLNWCFNVVLGERELGEKRHSEIEEVRKKVIYSLKEGYISPEPSQRAIKKGLSVAQARFLQNVLDPDISKPIRSFDTCIRNFLIVGLMLLYGLRPGEVLSLRLHDIEFGALSNVNVRRRRPSDEDSRSRPASVKRAGRILVLDNPRFAKLLNEYSVNGRELAVRRAKKKNISFFFLSRDGLPLSESSVQAMFRQLRNAYPEKLPGNLTAKSLRHTFTDGLYRELRRQGIPEDEARANLMYLRGDTGRESQDVYIDYHGQSKDAMNAYWLKVAGLRGAEDVPV